MKTYRKPAIDVYEIDSEDIVATSNEEPITMGQKAAVTNGTSLGDGIDYGNGGDGLVKSQTVDFSSDDDWGF